MQSLMCIKHMLHYLDASLSMIAAFIFKGINQHGNAMLINKDSLQVEDTEAKSDCAIQKEHILGLCDDQSCSEVAVPVTQ